MVTPEEITQIEKKSDEKLRLMEKRLENKLEDKFETMLKKLDEKLPNERNYNRYPDYYRGGNRGGFRGIFGSGGSSNRGRHPKGSPYKLDMTSAACRPGGTETNYHGPVFKIQISGRV